MRPIKMNLITDDKLTLDNEDCENEQETQYPIENFQLTTTPNDFNISTIISFLDAGIFKIPDFQRNYVWDINKASRLIESLLIGLPIPQMFLYEKSRNEFYVIDGQQRLMSIYFFIKGRFPKAETRILLKQKSGNNFIDEAFLADDKHFTNFSLKLNSENNPHQNKFHGLNYKTLNNEDKITLDLATIRNMIIKPTVESDDNSQAMFEIFNRLNSGGMNLNNQEIRMSLFNSGFIKMLQELNKNPTWRKLLNKSQPDLRLKDVESVLRIISMLLAGYNSTIPRVEYGNSMVGFLNRVANAEINIGNDEIEKITKIWNKFMQECNSFSSSDFNFSTGTNNQISVTFFESIFYGICRKAYDENDDNLIQVTPEIVFHLKNSDEFKGYATGKTSSKANVQNRLKFAYDFINGNSTD